MQNKIQNRKWLISLTTLFGLIALFFQQAMAQDARGVRLDDIVIEVVAEIEPDLVIDGVPDAVEDKLGGYVRLNRDDDNGNGTPDLGDSGVTVGENDLLVIELKTRRPRRDIPVTLSVIEKVKGKIRVWTGPQRTGEIVLPFTWKGKAAARGWLTEGNAGETVKIPDKIFAYSPTGYPRHQEIPILHLKSTTLLPGKRH